MARRGNGAASGGGAGNEGVGSSVDALLLAALARGEDGLQTGRFLVTYKEGATDAGIESLGTSGMRVADARDFDSQAASIDAVGDADAMVFPEIGVALLGSEAAAERGMSVQAAVADESPIASVDPEYFVFAQDVIDEAVRQRNESMFGEYRPPDDTARRFAADDDVGQRTAEPMRGAEYLRGFARAAEVIANDLRGMPTREPDDEELEAAVFGATWGLKACRVPQSTRSGLGIRSPCWTPAWIWDTQTSPGAPWRSRASSASPCRICTAMARTASGPHADRCRPPASRRATGSPTGHRFLGSSGFRVGSRHDSRGSRSSPPQ